MRIPISLPSDDRIAGESRFSYKERRLSNRLLFSVGGSEIAAPCFAALRGKVIAPDSSPAAPERVRIAALEKAADLA